MHVLITGGTGFVGSALASALRRRGDRVTVLTRKPREERDGIVFIGEVAALREPVDAVINLAGASLADRRWTDSYKRELRASRIDFTRALGNALRAAGQKPATFLSASAIGYYGARDEPVGEASAAGTGFAAELCRDWEAAAAEAADGARFCALRLGVVLGRGGGAYEQMAMPFRLRVGNWIGAGTQGLSWVHLDDVVAAFLFLLDSPALAGAFNVTAPEPTTSRGFCDAMQEVHRSLLRLPMPGAVMRLMLGEMADELLISGQQVLPTRLMESGFAFHYPQLELALRQLEGKAA